MMPGLYMQKALSYPHCPKCLNMLDVAPDGLPLTCPCNWRKPRAKSKVLSPTKPQSKSLWNRWRGRCAYCDKELAKKGKHVGPISGEAATRDHFIPLSAGGKNDKNNLVAACYSCNSFKSSLDPRRLLAIWHQLDPDGLQNAYNQLKEQTP